MMKAVSLKATTKVRQNRMWGDIDDATWIISKAIEDKPSVKEQAG